MARHAWILANEKAQIRERVFGLKGRSDLVRHGCANARVLRCESLLVAPALRAEFRRVGNGPVESRSGHGSALHGWARRTTACRHCSVASCRRRRETTQCTHLLSLLNEQMADNKPLTNEDFRRLIATPSVSAYSVSDGTAH